MSHLLFDLNGCEPDLLRSECFLTNMIKQAVEIAGLNIVECKSYKIGQEPNHWGITAFAVLKESHMSVHTWPEHNFCSVDLYSCKEFDGIAVVEYLKKSLGPMCNWTKMEIVKRDLPE